MKYGVRFHRGVSVAQIEKSQAYIHNEQANNRAEQHQQGGICNVFLFHNCAALLGSPKNPSIRRDRESNGIELVGVPVPRFDSCSAIVLTSDDRVHEISGTFSRSVCAIQMSLFDHSSLFSLANLAIRKSPRLLRYFNRLGTLDNRKQDISEAGPVADNFSYEITRRILFHLSETVRSNGAELILMAKSRDLKELQLSEQFLQRVLVVNTDSITKS